jgi:hypothetical protein
VAEQRAEFMTHTGCKTNGKRSMCSCKATHILTSNLAQLVEQMTQDHWGAGSIPAAANRQEEG